MKQITITAALLIAALFYLGGCGSSNEASVSAGGGGPAPIIVKGEVFYADSQSKPKADWERISNAEKYTVKIMSESGREVRSSLVENGSYYFEMIDVTKGIYDLKVVGPDNSLIGAKNDVHLDYRVNVHDLFAVRKQGAGGTTEGEENEIDVSPGDNDIQ